MECWGGATFDVAMRFLKEDPWERLVLLREAMPNILTQMLLRASNAVGYTNYPDNTVRFFVQQAAAHGMDLFRVFDSLNWVENMRVAMDAVLETGALCEAAICYTGDIQDPDRAKYDLKYYVNMAKELEQAGAHIIGIKDMAGVLKPPAATKLITTLREEVGLPLHFHAHDTSGIASASVYAAIEAGVDAVDGAIDSLSGLTSQPNLGSIATALKGHSRDPQLDPAALREIATYWEDVRGYYTGFESDIRSGTSDVYVHEMPGGQYTNLRQQARALGIEEKWPEVSRSYAEVNRMFGDVVKVTPSSKVVGDMALMMVTSGLSTDDVSNPEREIAFPESVVSFFRGDLGQPVGGLPVALQKKILKGQKPIEVRPGSVLEPVDLEATRQNLEKQIERKVGDASLASYLMYPTVFEDYVSHYKRYGNLSYLPTPVFFYGMQQGQEISVDIDQGKALVIRYLTTSDTTDEQGRRSVFFELNGQPRTIKIIDRSMEATGTIQPKAEEGNAAHVGAPMPGLIVSVSVDVGQKVKAGDVLFAIEAMKMETAVHSERDGEVLNITAPVGSHVDTKDLVVSFCD